MNKRQILLAAAALTLAPVGYAQTGASKPLRIVSSIGPGGPMDFVARTLAEQLGRELKRPVIVENRPGANDALDAMETLRSEPDGSTLWITSVGGAAINPAMVDKSSYDMQRDFAPVSMVVNNVEVLVVSTKDSAKDAAEFVNMAKASKESTPMGSSGSNSIPHLALIQLEESTGAKFSHVPYKGVAPAFTDLMGGQVQGVVADVAAVMPHAPSKTSSAMIERLNRAVHDVIANPDVKTRLLQGGAQPKSSTPQELGAILTADTTKWSALINSRNIKADQ